MILERDGDWRRWWRRSEPPADCVPVGVAIGETGARRAVFRRADGALWAGGFGVARPLGAREAREARVIEAGRKARPYRNPPRPTMGGNG